VDQVGPILTGLAAVAAIMWSALRGVKKNRDDLIERLHKSEMQEIVLAAKIDRLQAENDELRRTRRDDVGRGR
jgi:GTP-binding protein EngB required for normal cell division